MSYAYSESPNDKAVEHQRSPTSGVTVVDVPSSASTYLPFVRGHDESQSPHPSSGAASSHARRSISVNALRRFPTFRCSISDTLSRYSLYLSRKLTSKLWFRLAFLTIITLTFVITLAIGLRTAVGSHEPLRVRGVDGNSPRQGLFLYGGIREWDMTEKILYADLQHRAAVRWMPHQCGVSWGATGDCIGLNSNTLFFTDGDALGIPNFNYSNVALNFTASWQGFLKFGFEQCLTMDIPEQTRSGQINLFGLESDLLYPFDWYNVHFLVAAVSTDTDQTVPMAGASIFNPQQSQWSASTIYGYLDNLNGQATKLFVSVTLKRHLIVKFSAFLILIFNWLVTIALLYMTVLSVLGRRKLPGGMDSVALPFAGLFALPSVRGVMPGAPPFGCLLDFVGILPNLAIIAGCATSLLVSRLHREVTILLPFRDERGPPRVSAPPQSRQTEKAEEDML